MNKQMLSGQNHFTVSHLAPNAMIYTDQVLTCDSCKEKYESGFLVEMRGVGIFCFACFRPTFESYFQENPNVDYVLARGIGSLAYQRRNKNQL